MDGSISHRRFEGFDNESEGYSQLYHEWLDDILQINNLAVMKVVLYIFRHTCGFQEPDIWKHITNEEFMDGRHYADGSRMDQGTGLSENSVRHALTKAGEEGYILIKTDDRDKGRIRKYYKLHFRESK